MISLKHTGTTVRKLNVTLTYTCKGLTRMSDKYNNSALPSELLVLTQENNPCFKNKNCFKVLEFLLWPFPVDKHANYCPSITGANNNLFDLVL